MFPSLSVKRGLPTTLSRSRRRDILIPFFFGVLLCAGLSVMWGGRSATPFSSSSLDTAGDVGGLRAGAHVSSSDSIVNLARLEASISRIEKALEKGSDVALAPGSSVVGVAPAAEPPTTTTSTPASSSSTLLRRPIVLGMAKGIDLAGAYRFVRSLRASTQNAECVIFTDAASLAADPSLSVVYALYGITVVIFDLERHVPIGSRGWHPSSYRWLLMRDWLRSREGEGGGGASVFFADVRDTIFQTDIFAVASKSGLSSGFVAFQENKPTTIAQCGWNSGWVKDCFGVEGLAKVGGFVISCSGTSLASWSDALAYADLMADTMLAKPKCERNGIDQGMHNYFVYSGEEFKSYHTFYTPLPTYKWINLTLPPPPSSLSR
jgi:hypothetical protein